MDNIVEAAALTPPDDEHDPEGATIGFERALAIDLMTQAEADVEELDEALERLRAGAYGACGTCGVAIPAERLAAQPTAVTCVACARISTPAMSSRVRRSSKERRPPS